MGGSSSPPPPVYEPVQMPDPDAEDRKLRLETIGRHRRGRSGMIKTSEKGILNLSSITPNHKTLLGE